MWNNNVKDFNDAHFLFYFQGFFDILNHEKYLWFYRFALLSSASYLSDFSQINILEGRGKLNTLLRRIKKGDVLVLKEIDRLERNHKETKELLPKLVEVGVEVIVLDSKVFQIYIENLKKENKSFMDKIIQSQLEGVIDIFLLIAEEERNKIIQRTSKDRVKARERSFKDSRSSISYIWPDRWNR